MGGVVDGRVIGQGDSAALFRALLAAAAVDDDAARKLEVRWGEPLQSAVHAVIDGIGDDSLPDAVAERSSARCCT